MIWCRGRLLGIALVLCACVPDSVFGFSDTFSRSRLGRAIECPQGSYATAGISVFRRTDLTLTGIGLICRNPTTGIKNKIVSKIPGADEYEEYTRCAVPGTPFGPNDQWDKMAVEDYMTGVIAASIRTSRVLSLKAWSAICNTGLIPYATDKISIATSSHLRSCPENRYVTALLVEQDDDDGVIRGMRIRCKEASPGLITAISNEQLSNSPAYLTRLRDITGDTSYMICPAGSFLVGFNVWEDLERVNGMQMVCLNELTGLSKVSRTSGETLGHGSELLCKKGQNVHGLLTDFQEPHVLRSFAFSCTDGDVLETGEFSKVNEISAYMKCAKSTFVTGIIASMGRKGFVDLQFHCAAVSTGGTGMMFNSNEPYYGPLTALFDDPNVNQTVINRTSLEYYSQSSYKNTSFHTTFYQEHGHVFSCPEQWFATGIVSTFIGVRKDIVGVGLICRDPLTKETRIISSDVQRNEDMVDVSTRCAVIESANTTTDRYLKGLTLSINHESSPRRLEMIGGICDHGKNSVLLGSTEHAPASSMDVCEEGQYLSTVILETEAATNFVTGLTFLCRAPGPILIKLMTVEVPDHYIVRSRPEEVVVDDITSTVDLLCPKGSVGYGLKTWIDPHGVSAIQLICIDLTTRLPTFSSTAGSPVGIESQDTCGDETWSFGVLQGILTVFSPNLRGLAATCKGGDKTFEVGDVKSTQLPHPMSCADWRYFKGLVVKFSSNGIIDINGRCSMAFKDDFTLKIDNLDDFYSPAEPLDENYVSDTCGILDYQCQTRVATEFAVRFGFVGLVSVKTALSSSDSDRHCYFPDPSPPDLKLIDSSLASGGDIQSAAPAIVLSEQEKMAHLIEYCGTKKITAAKDGCIWNVKVLLRILWREGMSLMRAGVPTQSAFSLYVHGTHLVWNRANCAPEGNLTYIPVPVGYEGLYGIAAAQMISKMKIDNVSTISIGTSDRLAVSHRVAVDSILDLENEEKASNIDCSGNITIVSDVIPGTPTSVNSDESNVALLSTRQTPRFRFDGIYTSTIDEELRSGVNLHSSVDNRTMLPSLDRMYTFADITYDSMREEQCGDLYFKSKFSAVKGYSFVVDNQHCCSTNCYTFLFYGSHYGGTSALHECCRLCNKHRCDQLTDDQQGTEIYISQRTIIESPPKDRYPAAIFFLSV